MKVRSLAELKLKAFMSVDELYIDFSEIEKQQNAIIHRLIRVREEIPISTIEYELLNKLIAELAGQMKG